VDATRVQSGSPSFDGVGSGPGVFSSFDPVGSGPGIFSFSLEPPAATGAGDDNAEATDANDNPFALLGGSIFLSEKPMGNIPEATEATEADDVVPAPGGIFGFPFAAGDGNVATTPTAPGPSFSDALGGPSFGPSSEFVGAFKPKSFSLRGANPTGTDKSGSDDNP
jgi:hypothetical protein